MAAPEEIKKLLDQINKAYDKLGKAENPFANFDTSNIKDANATIKQLETALEGVKYRIELSNTSAKDLSDQLKSIVQEVKNTNTPAKDFEKSLKRSITQAQKLKYEEEDISKLNKKQLEQIKEKLKQSKIDNIQSAEKLLKETGLNEELIEQKKIAQSYLNDTEKAEDILITKLNQRIAQEEKISKLMGLGGAAVEGAQKALNKMGFGGLSNALGLDEVKKKMEEIAEGIEKADENADNFKNKFEVLKGGIKEAGSQLKNSLKDPLVVTGFLMDQMIDALTKADKETGELAKAFGTSYSEAAGLRDELNTMANLSGDVNITTSALQKSLIAVNKEFKTATMFTANLLEDFTNLTEVAGYTNEAAQRLSKISVATGTDLSDNTAKILGTAKAFNITNKLALNEKEIVEDVAKASKATTLSLGMQPGALTKAVAQAKALGANLEKVEAISQSLLNFESSIASELEAELLTGKDLNLERARMYALNNDIAGVAKEIAGQIGKASDFTRMNVIQQEALAKSVGMTREDLAASLIEREALAAIGDGDKTAVEAYNRLKKEGLSDDEIAVKLGDEQLANQLKSQSVQERFNASVEKLKEIFVSLAGPILQVVSPIVDILTPILSVISGIVGTIASGFGKILGPLAAGYAILKSTQVVLTAISALQTFITTSKASELGLGGSILATLGLQNAAEMYKLTLMDGGNKKRAIGAFLEQTMLGSIIAQGAAVLKNIGKSTIELGIKMGILSATLATNAALTFGVGVAVAVAAAAAGYAAIKALTADDMISSPEGYGKRTLLAPEGAIALNDNDTVIAGTNLGGKKSSSSVSSDMSRVEALLSQLVQKQDRPVQVSVEMDGEKVAKGVGNNSTKFSNSMSTNTFQVQ
jgi:hypothetical protein